MTYRTQELIELLQGERDACMNGDRLKLSATTARFSQEAEAILGIKGIQQIVSYHDFRTEVWKYQAQNLVSGIVWEEIDINGQVLRFPTLEDQLISLPSDVELMNSYKEHVVNFWRNVTQGLQLWQSGSNIKGHERPDTIISPGEADLLISQCEWATLSANTFAQELRRWTLNPEQYYQEIHIQLGWGWPELADYWQHWPEHGSEWITAVNPDAVEPEK